MRFAYPLALYLLFLMPILIMFYLIVLRKKKQALARFGNPALIKHLNIYSSKRKQILKIFLILFGFFFLILALSGPQIGKKLIQIKRTGLDIIVAIDTSLSMQATDIKPDRLTKAKMELSSFIDRLNGDRIGIIAFSGKAFLQCPLTLDYNAAKLFLNLIDTNLIPYPGTSIGDAIRLATKSFSQKERKYKALILLTDGEDHKSDPLDAAQEAQKEGIRIYTIGIGNPKGELIPIYNEQKTITGYKKDKKGTTVMSKLDETLLKKIALATDGNYYRASSGELEIEDMYEKISGLEKKQLQSKFFSQYEHRFYYFLAISFILLFIEFILSETKRSKRVV